MPQILLSLAFGPDDSPLGVRLHLATKTVELTPTSGQAHVELEEFDYEQIDPEST